MAGILIWILVALVALTQIALGVLVYQLLRQHGRLLLRLEELEGLARGPETAVADAAHAMPPGLSIGTPAPPFRLPDLTGELVGLEDFRGRRVLLVHWSPQCSFCDLIAADIASLEAKLREQGVDLLLVSYGSADANGALAAEYGLEAPILLQEAQIEAFRGLGTPAAYVLDAQGRVASRLALGSDQVLDLAHEAAVGRRRLGRERSVRESRIEREGLKPGTRAPAFELDDVRGRTVSLDDYRGRRVLLVFSDPDCGPCNALLPDFARLQDDATIVMVTRGDAAVNRAKVEEHGLEFPVAVQPGWQLSKQYGIFATPVAFLIDEDGVIAREVARGPDEILALAQDVVREEGPIHH